MKQSSAKKAGFRSNFELNLARALADRGVTYEYESTKLTYIPKPRTYTPDFFIPSTNKIYKGSKTTYADWATKNKFEWAEGSIPEEWYK
jgi:hypothetical protein